MVQLKHELRVDQVEMNTLVTTGKLIHYPKKPPQIVAVPTPPTTPQPNGQVTPVPVVKVIFLDF